MSTSVLRSDTRTAAERIAMAERSAMAESVAHASANRQVEEQQAQDEAAMFAAGATQGGPEVGATPITPGIIEPASGTGGSLAGALPGVGEIVLQDDGVVTPPNKKKRKVLKESDRRAIHLGDEWKDGEGFIPELTLTGQPFDMEDEAGAHFYESAKAPSIFGGARAHPQDPRRSSNPVKPSF